MRIQHNIAAMNSYRNYGNNVAAVNKNLEKLSSGYKVNRAGDDAAGLAVSEKMRAQITGLEAAQKNVKDGTNLVKTAEGAMQEVQDMLKRMKYLATESANGTFDNETDRFNLQKEVISLKNEIDRIADSANFNGIKLMDGSLGQREIVTADSVANGIRSIQIMGGGVGGSASPTNEGGPVNSAGFEAQFTTAATTADGVNVITLSNSKIDGIKWVAVGQEEDPGAAVSTNATGKFVGVNGGSVTFKAVLDEDVAGTDAAMSADIEHYLGMEVTVTVDAAAYNSATKTYKYATDSMDVKSYGEATGLQLQIGDTADDYNQLTVSIGDMHVNALGIGSVDISTQSGAQKAIQAILDATNKVSSTRGDLGAIQNRLDHTLNNLSVMTENIQDAESTIRDTDVAEEMMSYTKNNILIQSAQAMLAQANQIPQGVLQLLG